MHPTTPRSGLVIGLTLLIAGFASAADAQTVTYTGPGGQVDGTTTVTRQGNTIKTGTTLSGPGGRSASGSGSVVVTPTGATGTWIGTGPAGETVNGTAQIKQDGSVVTGTGAANGSRGGSLTASGQYDQSTGTASGSITATTPKGKTVSASVEAKDIGSGTGTVSGGTARPQDGNRSGGRASGPGRKR